MKKYAWVLAIVLWVGVVASLSGCGVPHSTQGDGGGEVVH